jgi:excisionase family DNA binding protein
MSANDLLTVAEFAESARVSERTVRRWIAAGRVRSVRQGKRYLIPRTQTASAQLSAGSPTPPPTAPIGETALRRLLFWMCDAWVEDGRAFNQLLAQDPDGALRQFHGLVAQIDRDAPRTVDSALAVQLRFVARDLVTRAQQGGLAAAQPIAATAPLAASPTLETLPLSSVLPAPVED